MDDSNLMLATLQKEQTRVEALVKEGIIKIL